MLNKDLINLLSKNQNLISKEIEKKSKLLGASEVTANLYCNCVRLYWEGCVIFSIYICGNIWYTLRRLYAAKVILRGHCLFQVTLCPRSLDPFYIVCSSIININILIIADWSNFVKWVKTSGTYRTFAASSKKSCPFLHGQEFLDLQYTCHTSVILRFDLKWQSVQSSNRKIMKQTTREKELNFKKVRKKIYALKSF